MGLEWESRCCTHRLTHKHNDTRTRGEEWEDALVLVEGPALVLVAEHLVVIGGVWYAMKF